MTEPDPNFENFLQSLAAAPPSEKLRSRVAHELDLDSQWLPAPRRRLAPRWLAAPAWGALGAAAAVALMTAFDTNRAEPNAALTRSTPVSSVMPVTVIRELVDAQDEGIRYNSQSRLPEQHVNYVTVERRAWIDPRDGAEITIEVPREEKVVLPVSFQ
jgi:hypothetical protein